MKIFLLPMITVLMSVVAVADTNLALADYQWRKRVLVVLAPSENDPQLKMQIATNAGAADGFSERDLIVVAEIGSDGPLHRKFSIAGNDFQVLLIGKDGHTILKWPKPVGSEELYSVIDAMPMRRDEIHRKKKGS